MNAFWLVENPQSEYNPEPTWYSCEQFGFDGRFDKATRFERKQDAEAFIKAMTRCGVFIASNQFVATEHMTLPNGGKR